MLCAAWAPIGPHSARVCPPSLRQCTLLGGLRAWRWDKTLQPLRACRAHTITPSTTAWALGSRPPHQGGAGGLHRWAEGGLVSLRLCCDPRAGSWRWWG